MTEKTPSLDEWDDFAGDFLKADLVKFPVQLVVVSVESEFDDNDKARLFILTEYNKRKKKLELNKTNQNFVRASDLTPKALIGKKLTFDKIMVRNPVSGKQVPSFLLTQIE